MRKRLLVGVFVVVLGLGFTATLKLAESFNGGGVYVACTGGGGDYCAGGG